MDYILAVNWVEAQKANDAGKGRMIGGVPVLDPKDVKGICSKESSSPSTS
jgi:hypothetical protein